MSIIFIVLISFVGFMLAVFLGFSLKGKKKSQLSSEESSEEDGPSDLSLRDSVTGLYNRRHLVQRLSATMARCSRTKDRMAVILWDIDGFIGFNNKFGQKEGDKLLKKVADIIRRSLRVYDEAFRSGADEFCAIFLPAEEAVVREVTRRIIETVTRDLFGEGSEYAGHRFSMSSGVVFYPGDYQLPESLLHALSQSLYRSRMERTHGSVEDPEA